MGINVLNYFESLIQNTAVANKLINATFINLLSKMLSSFKFSQLKARICSVIGLLIRFATVIDNDVAESGMCEMLLEMLKEKNETLKRKAMASAGEYLFYAATQMDDESADTVWDISPLNVAAVVRCLKPGEDDIVKNYACKTIENIVSQSMTAGYKFSTIETASLLLNIFNTTKNDTLRISAAVAISHVCKLNSSVFPTFFDVFGFGNFCGVLADNHIRIQQAFITLLLFALKNSYQLVENLFLANIAKDPLLPSIATLIESSNPVVKGKCILTVVYMMQNNISWIPLLGNQGLYPHIDRVARDSYKYLKSCITTLCDTMEKVATDVLSVITEELQNKLRVKNSKQHIDGSNSIDSKLANDALHKIMLKTAPHLSSGTDTSIFKGQLIYIQILQDMTQSQALRAHIITAKSLKLLSDLFELSEAKEYDCVVLALVHLLECLSSNPKLLPGYCEVILHSLLPALISRIYSKHEEIRYLCFKLVCDIFLNI